MLKHDKTLPRDKAGQIDSDSWLSALLATFPNVNAQKLRAAVNFLKHNRPNEILIARSLEHSQLMAELKSHTNGVIAALVYRLVLADGLSRSDLEAVLGSRVSMLLQSLVQADQLSMLELSSSRLQWREAQDQVDNIRRMMTALINDPMVAVIKLAERVVELRHARDITPQNQRRIAQEVLLFFSPLANRLGIWQLKWELEDLAFRYLNEQAYHHIALQLDGRRAERERRIEEIVDDLQTHLNSAGVRASVSGRAKHIFSIWRKMRTKNVALNEVYDVRAVRVIVDDIANCYVALGLIHTRWRHIPKEFDDYIAAPKENGYRSIHTAVLGPDEQALEVQIRTTEMHEEAELGLCAHWAYKDDTGVDQPALSRTSFNPSDGEKIGWLRQMLEWQNDLADGSERALQTLALDANERIFVYTPKGHVLDFAAGATPIDFAYRVHTDIGHHCVKALVNGLPQALNEPLQTGQRVEIVTDSTISPDRLWLETELAFVKTRRAREKLSEFFGIMQPSEQETVGRNLICELFGRIGLQLPPEKRLIALTGAQGQADARLLYTRLGAGSVSVFELLAELLQQTEVPRSSLLEQASCASPSSPGLVDYAIALEATDRDGLLRDIAMLLGREGAYLQSTSARADDKSEARILLEIKLVGLYELARIVEFLRAVPSVLQVNRVI